MTLPHSCYKKLGFSFLLSLGLASSAHAETKTVNLLLDGHRLAQPRDLYDLVNEGFSTKDVVVGYSDAAVWGGDSSPTRCMDGTVFRKNITPKAHFNFATQVYECDDDGCYMSLHIDFVYLHALERLDYPDYEETAKNYWLPYPDGAFMALCGKQYVASIEMGEGFQVVLKGKMAGKKAELKELENKVFRLIADGNTVSVDRGLMLFKGFLRRMSGVFANFVRHGVSKRGYPSPDLDSISQYKLEDLSEFMASVIKNCHFLPWRNYVNSEGEHFTGLLQIGVVTLADYPNAKQSSAKAEL
jgi:hypothetical protein